MVIQKRIHRFRFPFMVAAVAGVGTWAGCGSATDIKDFDYGEGQPGVINGVPLSEGGEILLERIDFNLSVDDQPGYTYTTFHGYQFDSTSYFGAKLPQPGDCVYLADSQLNVDGSPYWPTQDIPDSQVTQIDWGPNITLTRADGEQWLVPKVEPDSAAEGGLPDNRPNYNRQHPFLYGGPSWQVGFPVSAWVEETEYTVNLPGADGEPMTFFTPPFHEEPLDIGQTDDAVVIPATGDWEITWPAVTQGGGVGHSKQKHLTFLAFARVEDGGAIATGLCLAANDGSLTVPRAFLVNLASSGIIQSGRFTHFMDRRGDRRFDLVAIDCTIGWYEKEGASL